MTPESEAVRGADPDAVRSALDREAPLSGAGGFAGRLDVAPGFDGPVLVRDVLGREPLFSEATAPDPTAADAWARDPTRLDDPVRVPPGAVRNADGDVGVLSLPDPEADAPDGALEAVRSAMDREFGFGRDASAIDAVAFSGGIDSALVAAAQPDVPLYVTGFDGSHDVAAAREAADAMGRDLSVIDLSHDDLVDAVPSLARAIGRTNPMDVQIALPLYLTARVAAADGHRTLGLGQGADELFGGYAKVVDPADDHRVDADTVRAARRETVATLPTQLERDVLALRAAGVEPVTPFLADDVVDAALRLPGSLLATPEERKIALRRAADGLVPDDVRRSDKKAVQYGTYVSRELDRLARQNGFKRRMDDHVGQYVRELVAEAGVEVPTVGDRT